jgi:single-strand DNA-binding protein
MNSVSLCGYVGQDPELRHTNSGQAVLKIRLSTRERFKSKSGEWQDATEWHDVVMWGKRGETLERMIRRGSCIAVLGSLRTRSWEKDGVKRYSTEVVAKDITLTTKAGADRGDYQENQGQEDYQDETASGFG